MAMFPLGSALLPGMVLPLRLFEDRYLKMYADIVDGDREFGVVLIERGMESREDNLTFNVGCTARIIGSGVNDDGTIGLVSVGRNRFRIDGWLKSDPYPRAMVTDLTEGRLSDSGLRTVRETADLLSSLLELAAELNPDVETEMPELADNPELAMYQMAQLAGLQAIDLQQILETSSSDTRAGLIKEKVGDTIELVRLQLDMRDS